MAILCLAAVCESLCQSDENKSTSSLMSSNEESRCLKISDDIDVLDIVDDLEYLAVVLRSCTNSVAVDEVFAVADELVKRSSPSLLFMLNRLKEETSLYFSPIFDLLLTEDCEAAAAVWCCAPAARLCGEAGLRGKPKSSSDASGRLRRLRRTSASSA